jgi:SAM-dependent methyltransferase
MGSATSNQVKTQAPLIDQTKMEAFLHKAVNDFGAAVSAALVVIGDKLGLYKAMSHGGQMTPAELARRTGTHERYVREWLVNQAASGYVDYDPATQTYSLSHEHAMALADERSPFFVGGGFQVVTAMMKAEPRISQAFMEGHGMFWGEHDPGLFEGTERFFRPGYVAHLVTEWIPALEGVKERLERGGAVADVGCGHGASTIIMAQAFPRSRFYGFDNHAPSINRAHRLGHESGVADRVIFEIAGSTTFPLRERYDLIAFFDCLHDFGDPVGAIQRAREAIAPDGNVLIVEPMAGETVEANLNPVGRVYSGASVLCCTPNAMASGQTALGTLATEAALREVVNKGGFTRFRRAAETPFNRVFEARP